MDKLHILIVDDTLKNIQVLDPVLKKEGYQIHIAQTNSQVLQLAFKITPDLILLDVQTPEPDGFEVCKQLKAYDTTKEIPIIFLTGKVPTETITKAFQLGAVDYITKPFNATELLARMRSHLTASRLQKKLTRQRRVIKELFYEASYRVDGILLGESSAIAKVRSAIFQYAKTSEPLLLIGPPGAGAEAIARAIHNVSERLQNPFMYLNCTNLQTQIGQNPFSINSTTDLNSDTISKFDLADGGTIFIEGIQDLTETMQKQLLGTLLDLAKDSLKTPDIRIIAYTRYNLVEEIEDGKFDIILYELLKKNFFCIPSLEERSEDIPVLTNYFASQYARSVGRNLEKISPASIERLSQYSWPGNIRELRNVVERAIVSSDGNTLEISEESSDKGATVDRYQLEERIGKGGVGEVWRAKHELLARPAAIKLIRPEKREKANTLKRFQREAQAIANLLSPNTVKLYDYGFTNTGSFYYVMELLNGMDLGTLVKRFGPQPEERVVLLLLQACRSLMEAHEVGLIHRDIKPQNLFTCKLGAEYDFLKVLDFGIVKYQGQNMGPGITIATEFIGTPMYASPELLIGQDIDERTDIYSLGCVAYRVLSGNYLFTGPNIQQLVVQHLTSSPNPLSMHVKLTPKLEELVMACLDKKPENRPSSIRELFELLSDLKLAEAWDQKRAKLWWEEQAPEYTKIQYREQLSHFYEADDE